MFCEVDENDYFICDAPHASRDEPNVRPYTALDGTKPDGMRKARWTGALSEDAGEWIGGSWVDEEAAELAAEQFAAAMAHKMDEIRSAMDATLAAGFTCDNGITMDATDADIRKLEDGCRRAPYRNATTMDIRDYHNARHSGTPLADVEVMVNELDMNWLGKWNHKCDLQEAVTAIAARTELAPADLDYLDHSAAIETLKGIIWS